MPKDTIRTLNPLSESEQFQLNRLLARTGENLAEATRRREKELALQAKLQAKRDKLAAEEAALSRRLSELRIDIDCVSAEIHKIAPSGISWRFVNDRLQQFGDLVTKQSFFGTRSDNLDRDQIQLLGELALAIFEMNTKPKGGRPLRERMESVKIDVGLDPGDVPGGPSDGRAALAQAIVRAGRRARGEEP
jgi:hypothetical protein